MNFNEVSRVDPLVYEMINRGATSQQIIVAMSERNQKMLARLFELESICPRKRRMRDGTVYIWRCPDDLIPIEELSPGSCETSPSLGQPR